MRVLQLYKTVNKLSTKSFVRTSKQTYDKQKIS